MSDTKRIVGIVVALLLPACAAGTVSQALFGMRDTRVSREQASGLVRIVLVPVQVRPAVLTAGHGARWEEVALLNDDRLLDVLRAAARDINVVGVHRVRVADRGVVVQAAAEEPMVMLVRWVKSDRASAGPDPDVSDADAILEVAWARFAGEVRNVAVTARLVDARSGRILGRAGRGIWDSPFPPTPEHGRAAVESAARGVGLVTRK